MERIKILHLIAPTTLAGAERVVLNIVELINTNDFEPVVGSFVFVKRKNNLFVNELNKRNLRHHAVLMRSTFDLRNIYEIIKIIEADGVDILHTHGYRSDIIGLICAKLTRRPIISTVHGWTPTTMRVRIYEFLDRLALCFFDRIIAVSKEVEESLVKAWISKTKITLVPNAILYHKSGGNGTEGDVRSELRLENKVRIVGTVARLSKEKGIDFLIHAIAEVLKEFRDVVLLIVGEGLEKERLASLCEKLAVRDHVIFHGFESEINRIYSSIDVFALSSLTEGTPMALLEAMAYGVPVVASKVGEVPDIINNGVNGLLVQAADYKGLSDGILRLLSHPSEAKRMAVAGKRTIEVEFDIKRWIREIESLYKMAVR